jgi:hypothetical protein
MMPILHAGDVGIIAETIVVIAGVLLSLGAAWLAFAPASKPKRRRRADLLNEDVDRGA